MPAIGHKYYIQPMSRTQKSLFLQLLCAGIASAIITAVIANAALAMLVLVTGTSFPELSALVITIVSVGANFAGVFIFLVLEHLTKRPTLPFMALSLGLATVGSWYVTLSPYPPGFALQAAVLNYVVAITIMITLPGIAVSSLKPPAEKPVEEDQRFNP